MSTLSFSSFPELNGKRIQCVVRISGAASESFAGIEYVIEAYSEDEGRAFEIRYEYRCSPFRKCLRVGDVLAVGHEEHFYLYDTSGMEQLLVLPIEGYFGHLYFDGGRFYVAGCCDLHCVDPSGRIIWKSDLLGIDGVVVEGFEEQCIRGVGEYDPPGGWRPFSIDRLTGRKLL